MFRPSKDSQAAVPTCSVLIASIATILSASAQAQSANASDAQNAEPVGTLAEIVVTAQRRSQSMQSVPIAVTALTADTLRDVGLSNISSLEAVVPSLTVARNGAIVSPYLRGVGTNYLGLNVEPSVATYVDGVYVASGLTAYPFNNIERIEVLKGPQGTLFGRNATGGIVQIITKDPTREAQGDFSVGYGNYQTVTSSAYVAGGLTEALRADVAVYYKDQGEGFGRNILLGQETSKRQELSARSKILYTPGDDTEIRFTIGYDNSDGTPEEQKVSPTGTGPGGATFLGRNRSAQGEIGYLEDTALSASLRIDHDFSFARLSSISAYADSERNMLVDSDVVPENIVLSDTTGKMNNFSQEVQLLSAEGSSLDWVLGAYYLDASYEYDPLQVTGSSIGAIPYLNIYGTQNTTSFAVYGQGTYALAPKLNATLGLRYTWDDQDIVSAQVSPAFSRDYPKRTIRVDEPTWRAALDYQLTDDVLAYVSYNRGMKSGGYNIVSPGRPGFAPEILDAYELGIKSTLFDNVLRLNVAAFYYDYKDIQVNVVEASVINIVNAAGAKIQGIDVDFLAALTADLTLSGGVGYIDSEYTNYRNAAVYGPGPGAVILIDADGKHTPNAPELTGNLTMSYRMPVSFGDFRLNGSVVYNDGYYTEPSNRVILPSYTLLNASVSWNSPQERYAIELWGNNLTDKYYLTQRVSSALGDKQVDAAPRTYGVTLRARF